MSTLQRSLGTFSLVALGAAGVVGTSWIYTNGEFFSLYGAGGEIFGLVVAALLASGVAMAYAELAGALPRAGGEVVYAYTAFNRPAAFAAGWLLIGAYVSSLAFYVTAFGFLLADVVPSLESAPLYSIEGTPVHAPVLGLGVALLLLVLGLSWFRASLGGAVQILLFVVMIVLGAALVVVGFVHGSPDNFWPPYAPDAQPVAETARFVLPGLTFLTGFGLVAILAEDADVEPRRLGRVVVTCVAVAASFYCLVLLSSAWVIPWERTAELPRGTIDAFREAGYDALGWAAYAIAVLGLLTSFLALFMATSRIVLAMGRAGLLPSVLARLGGPRSTPGPALVFTFVVTLVLGLLGEAATTWFLDTGGVYIGLAWALGVACLYRMPHRFPELERPYRPRLRWLPGWVRSPVSASSPSRSGPGRACRCCGPRSTRSSAPGWSSDSSCTCSRAATTTAPGASCSAPTTSGPSAGGARESLDPGRRGDHYQEIDRDPEILVRVRAKRYEDGPLTS